MLREQTCYLTSNLWVRQLPRISFLSSPLNRGPDETGRHKRCHEALVVFGEHALDPTRERFLNVALHAGHEAKVYVLDAEAKAKSMVKTKLIEKTQDSSMSNE